MLKNEIKNKRVRLKLPKYPSRVLFGLREGTILFLPNALPQIYAKISIEDIKIIKNKK
jgi:hypothetical protein